MVKSDDEKGENEAHIPGMAFTHFTRAGKTLNIYVSPGILKELLKIQA